MTLISLNPFTEEVNGEFQSMDHAQCEKAAEEARTAFDSWGTTSVAERTEQARKTGGILRQGKRRFAEIITKEMGKPIAQALSEIDKCAWLCDYCSENSAHFLKNEPIETGARNSYVTFEPLGVILGIMPWNFPFWQVFRFAVPALTAGNTCLLKHSSNVPLSALAIEEIFDAAGYPPNVFRSLLTDSDTARGLIDNELVDGVSMTGSVDAGSEVGSAAGKHLKKMVLELGGSDPFIVLDEANVGQAVEAAIAARMFNTGQSCIAAKRFIVMKSVAAEFQQRLVDRFKSLKMGNPMDENTHIGPVARREFVQVLDDQLADAVKKGGTVFYSQGPLPETGFFFRPAVVVHVTPDMRIVREEVFGPIAPILVAGSDEEAAVLANSTPYGLGASIWSWNTARAERLSRKIRAGFVAINDLVRSDPRLPFGGVKKSGVGRELSHYGLKEFVNVKAVVIK